MRMRQMARIFLIIKGRIIDRGFAGGPCFFPGFGRGVSIPDLIYAGYLPVTAMVLSSVSIPLCISGGPHFTYSALILVRLLRRSFGFSCFWMLFRFLRL